MGSADLRMVSCLGFETTKFVLQAILGGRTESQRDHAINKKREYYSRAPHSKPAPLLGVSLQPA